MGKPSQLWRSFQGARGPNPTLGFLGKGFCNGKTGPQNVWLWKNSGAGAWESQTAVGNRDCARERNKCEKHCGRRTGDIWYQNMEGKLCREVGWRSQSLSLTFKPRRLGKWRCSEHSTWFEWKNNTLEREEENVSQDYFVIDLPISWVTLFLGETQRSTIHSLNLEL